MKIGLSTWSFPWAITAGKTLYELADRAAQTGAEVFQIADNSSFFRMTKAEQGSILHYFDERGMEIELGIAELSEHALRPIIELCGEYGVKLLRTLPHVHGAEMTYEDALHTLRVVTPYLRADNVVLAIENHDYYPAAWLKKLVRETDSSHVGICLDAVNSLGQGESFREVLAALGEYTVNFHCKDYVIRRKKSRLGFEVSGCACGDGMLDFALAAQRCKDVSWIVELWTDEAETIGATVDSEWERAERSIAFLKNFRNDFRMSEQFVGE